MDKEKKARISPALFISGTILISTILGLFAWSWIWAITDDNGDIMLPVFFTIIAILAIVILVFAVSLANYFIERD